MSFMTSNFGKCGTSKPLMEVHSRESRISTGPSISTRPLKCGALSKFDKATLLAQASKFLYFKEIFFKIQIIINFYANTPLTRGAVVSSRTKIWRNLFSPAIVSSVSFLVNTLFISMPLTRLSFT